VSEDGGAHRPGDEADVENDVRLQRPDQRIGSGKKYLREN
jgi:hypothetical protein